MTRAKTAHLSGIGHRNGVSISDVASEANVSIATVSRVINTPEKVAAATAERVQETIKRLRYRPNMFAKGLVTRRSRVLGVSLPNLHGDYYSALMRAADERAHELGYHLLVTSSANEPDEESSGFAMDLIDGLITMITESDADIETLKRMHVPAAAVVARVTDDLPFDTITVDNGSGAREATAHLLGGTAAEHCYIVAGHEGNFDSDARCRAFVETLARAGHDANDDQVAHGEYAVAWGREWANAMIHSGKLAGAAVLAGNDEIAVGVIDSAIDAGMSVPGDLRVVGFDDSPVCRLLRPKLSSVHVPVRAVAIAAVDAVIHRIEQPDAEPARVELTTRLVIRDSSTPVFGTEKDR